LPLYDFFIELKKNNFLVTPEQITDANRIISEYAAGVRNEQELCHYLAPVFANSREEQIQFREIFEEFFTPRAEKIAAKAQKAAAPAKKQAQLKKHGWKYLLGFLLLAGLAYWIFRKPPSDHEVPLKDLHISASLRVMESSDVLPGQKIPGTKKWVKLEWQMEDSIKEVTLKSTVDWGDGSPADSLPYHIYKTEGTYSFTGFVNVYHHGKFQYADTIYETIPVCFSSAAIHFIMAGDEDTVKINEPVVFTPNPIGRRPDSILYSYSLNGRELEKRTAVFSGKNRYTYTFDEQGTGRFDYWAYYGDPNSPCSVRGFLEFDVVDPSPKPRVSFHPSASANKIRFYYKVLPKWFYLAGILAVLSLTLSVFFSLRWSRSRKKAPGGSGKTIRQYDEMLRSFSGKTGSVEIPFAGKNYLPLPEPELSDVARFMRRRISDDATYMHVQKTIAKATRNAGFFDPVIDTRTQQSEFLVLIDARYDNDQPVKLFEFLLDLLKKQNVFIDKYYFRNEPALCYHDSESDPISLEKLSEKYPEHILVILGNAYQFIHPDYPVFDQTYLRLLSRWPYKAIMTPVSYSDWGNKEKKILLPEIAVFPVDLPGLELMMHKLFGEEVNVLAELYQHSDEFYETDTVDFEDMDELAEYCKGAEWARVPGNQPSANILFQWIASLAVYPRLNWNLTLAIGKALLDQYGCTQQLNYTTLLRLVRISWMRSGKIPDYTRLNLLKELSKENEITARETILALLNEIPEADLNKDHFAYEEKETQRLVNEFNLYACNPVKYAAYKESHDLFARMHLNQQVTDLTTKAYLETKDLGWKTLIQSDAGQDANEQQKEPVRLSDYLGDPSGKSSWLTSLYLWIASLASLAFVFTVLGSIFLAILHFTGSYNLSPFTYVKDVNKNILFNYTRYIDDSVRRDLILTMDTTEVTLLQSTAGKGTAETGTIITLAADSTFKQLTVNWGNKELLDTLVQITHDSYDVELLPADAKRRATVYPTVSLIVPGNCQTGLDAYRRTIQEIDPAIAIREYKSGDLLAESQKEITGYCLDRVVAGSKVDPDLLNKIIKGFTNLSLNLKPVEKGNSTLNPGDEEIIIFNSNTRQDPDKPEVLIQISSDTLQSNANKFRKKLQSMGFSVRPVEVARHNYTNDIYFFTPALEKVANVIKQVYTGFYPTMQVNAHLKTANNQLSVANTIVVWIKEPEKVVLDGTNITQVKYWNKDGSVIGDFYINPKTGQWEEFNNDPLNNGKTKYFNLYSRDKNKIVLLSATEKLSIHIELNRKKIMLRDDPNARELYDIVGISNNPNPVLSNAPNPVITDTSKRDLPPSLLSKSKEIYFATGSSKLLAKSLHVLNDIVRVLLENPSYQLIVESHTDNEGKDELNQQLTQQRAESVKAYLVSKGIEESRVTAIGYGESKPIADNTTARGRAQNRRTELILKAY